MKYRAWLDAVPDMPTVCPCCSDKKNSHTREFLYRDVYDSELVNMPSIERNHYVLAWLSEIGFCMSGGMGVTPITHTELNAWRDNVGAVLEPNDVNLLMMLSRVYVGQLGKSKDRDEPPPVAMEVKDKAALGDRIKSAFRRIKPSI